jgi:hypothetical protein
MKLDVRTPIGAMFSVFGAVLTGYGLFGDQSAAIAKAGGNANLIWGLALLGFGAVLLARVFRARGRDAQAKGAPGGPAA